MERRRCKQTGLFFLSSMFIVVCFHILLIADCLHKQKYRYQLPTASIVTFIVPSQGRATLSRTLDALLAQTNPNWKAVIIFDGLYGDNNYESGIPTFLRLSEVYKNDERILFINLPSKVGISNCAGDLRNFGIAICNSDWIALVDDDDSISHDYVEVLVHEAVLTGADLILFHMFTGDDLHGKYMPAPEADYLKIGSFGISYAFKRSLYPQHKFAPSISEDFLFLSDVCSSHKCAIAPYATYFVRGKTPHGRKTNIEIGKRIVNPKIMITATDNKFIDFTAHHCYYQNLTKTLSPFIFTEQQDKFLFSIILALKANMNEAFRKGCIRWRRGEQVHVIFGKETKPITGKYIQVHVRYGFNASVDDFYLTKLKEASQVWTYSKDNAVQLEQDFSLKQVFVVPPALFYNDDISTFRCYQSDFTNEMYEHFEVYHAGCNREWQLNLEFGKFTLKSARLSKCSYENRNCGLEVDFTNPDILVLGKADCFIKNNMEDLCGEGNKAAVSCMQTLIKPQIRRVICDAKVIVIDIMTSKTVLDTVFYETLLSSGKAIVSTPTPDGALTQFYSKFVKFVPKQELISEAKKIVENWASWAGILRQKQAHYVDMREKLGLQPLCHALGALNNET